MDVGAVLRVAILEHWQPARAAAVGCSQQVVGERVARVAAVGHQVPCGVGRELRGVDPVVNQAAVSTGIRVLLPCPAVPDGRAEAVLVVAADIAEARIELVVVVDVAEVSVGTAEACETLDALCEHAPRVERAGDSERGENVAHLARLVAKQGLVA